MGVIVPAILPTSRQDLEGKLAIIAGHADAVQIDSVDGRFASPACWPYGDGMGEFAQMTAQSETLPHFGEFTIEADLMVADAEAMAGKWIALGASRIVIHAGSAGALGQAIGSISAAYGRDPSFMPAVLSIGLAVGLATDINVIDAFAGQIDFVQFMGIRRIGVQGQPFDADVLRRVAAVRKKYPKLPVQVDGGVTRASAPGLLAAGVSRLIVGSAIWKAEHPLVELAAFQGLAEQYGIYE